VFDLGDDGTAVVLRDQVDAAQAEDVASAAHLCTAQAIVLRTDGPAKER
jgi:ferredoxin